MGVVEEELLQPRPLAHEVLLFPSDEARQKLCSWIGSATTTLECCVFVISDARVAAELKEAAARGVAVRLITDDKTALDGGSQVFGMASAGVETLVDPDYELKSGAAPVPRHMHHKYAIVDGRVLLCGSYNWSYSASARNNENCVVTEDVYLVAKYSAEFERLWREFKAAAPLSQQQAAIRIQQIERGNRERRRFAAMARSHRAANVFDVARSAMDIASPGNRKRGRG